MDRTLSSLWIVFAVASSGWLGRAAEEPLPLWQIGVPDGDDREFALAPGGYADYQADGFFIVGQSNPKQDWPYVHPGTTDPWAGSDVHPFIIAFGLDTPPTAGGKLVVALVDTHSTHPPRLVLKVNGTPFSHEVPAGAGDDSVFGHPEKGKPYRFEIAVAANLLKAGVNTIEITAEDGSWVLYDCLALYAPGARLGKVPEGAVKRPPGPVRVEVIIVAFKTHFDIGYTALARDVVQRYRGPMMDQALKVCEASRGLPPEQQFVWTIPGWPMAKILEEGAGQTPERKARIEQALKDGRFVVHGLPFTTHTETLEPEDLVRGLGFSSRTSRALSLPLPRDAKMTDVASHCWILPTLLRHAGIEFLHLGCNAACRSPQVPRLFWWEGPDGSRLLTMYTAEGYGTGLYAPRGWPYPVWLALIHTGDNHGPPTPDEVSKLLDEAARKLPGVKVRIGRLSDFADALLRHNPQIPVVRGDMPDTWIHGPMCDPAGAKIARHIRPLISATGALQTNLRLWGVQAPDAGPALAEAFEKSLLYGEHTWGGALYWVTSYAPGQVKFGYGDVFKADREAGRFKRLEESWAEHSGYIERARDLVTPVLTAEMEALAKAVQADGWHIVVYNPLPWKRDGMVEVTRNTAGPVSLRSGGAGEVQTLMADTVDGKLCFLARNVPACGYRVYVPNKAEVDSQPLRADAGAAAIESPSFKAILDPARCAVKSLLDKRTGRELIDAASPYGFGQYLYERFDAEQVAGFLKAYVKIQADWASNEIGKPLLPAKEQAPYAAASPANGTLRMETGACSVSAVMSAAAGGGVPHALTARLTLYAGLPYADFEVTLHDKPADAWPEAGWLCFPFRTEAPQFRLGRLGAIIDPAKDCMAGCNNEMFWLNSGLAVLDQQGRGAGLCPLDHPLVSLGQPGLWRYTRQFTPRRPVVFVNLFNNQWTTNFRMWNSGTWTSRVRIWSIDKYDTGEPLATPCLEARTPLLAACNAEPGGKLPAVQSGIELERTGVALTAFGPNPDGVGLVLRLWEMAGMGGTCRVRLPAELRVTSAQPCNLRGQPSGEALKILDGALALPLTPFAPASVILKP